MSARNRPSSQLPKAPTSLSPTCVIADTAVLTGTHQITIGANSIIHPRARIVSTHGPVTIGEGCIISEKAVIGLQTAPDDSNIDTDSPSHAIELDRDVVVEPSTTVEGNKVGEGSTLEAGSKICAGAVLGKYCKVAPLCTVPVGEVLDDFTIIFGNNQRRKEAPGLEGHRKITHDKELEVLRKLIPTNLAKWQTDGNE